MIQPTPYHLRNAVGRAQDYFVHSGYTVRTEEVPFDDTPFTDEFQREVYQYARQLADQHKYRYVVDVGCGSGYKLVRFFDEHTICGMDVEKTIEFCVEKYPFKACWQVLDFAAPPPFKPDLVICADVIEHMACPQQALNYLAAMQPRRAIISTPERDQLCAGTHNGPPHNQHHIREWNTAELHAYMATMFHKVVNHFVIAGTQVVEIEF